ncbi:MAG: aminodeoxychorismate synthase component I [Planctomycetota bacterium]
MSTLLSVLPLRVRAERMSCRALPGDLLPLVTSRPHPFFLDSLGRDSSLARYSFLGSDPFLILSAQGNEITERTRPARRPSRTAVRKGNPFRALKNALSRFAVEASPCPCPFVGGAVGFFGYDLRHFVEKLPSRADRDCSIPDMYFAFYDALLAYDHSSSEWTALALEGPDGKTPGGKRVRDVLRDLRDLLLDADPVTDPSPRCVPRLRDGLIRSNFTRDGYLAAVRRALDYIGAGDIFQVNLSQRFQTRLALPPAELYRVLRGVNPAPFAAFLASDDWAVLSSSPERFLLLRGSNVSTRPIKGTRKHTGDPRADAALRSDLLASPKDRAELVMIVDLERNDLGRVCTYGSVRVTQPVVLEEHPTVFHLVATVEGRLHPAFGPVDLVRASFPGGSITGAPKVRAMEIIDELEPTARNLYTGSLGYIGFDGSMDLSIVIRTFLVDRSIVTFQVGGGIVADSDPPAEYEETLHKGRALLAALGFSGDPAE